jgi:hypothetical protein
MANLHRSNWTLRPADFERKGDCDDATHPGSDELPRVTLSRHIHLTGKRQMRAESELVKAGVMTTTVLTVFCGLCWFRPGCVSSF